MYTRTGHVDEILLPVSAFVFVFCHPNIKPNTKIIIFRCTLQCTLYKLACLAHRIMTQ